MHTGPIPRACYVWLRKFFAISSQVANIGAEPQLRDFYSHILNPFSFPPPSGLYILVCTRSCPDACVGLHAIVPLAKRQNTGSKFLNVDCDASNVFENQPVAKLGFSQRLCIAKICPILSTVESRRNWNLARIPKYPIFAIHP